tara:strand:+ start:234 stop:623 length:390 start_codon:yes stop_codon:yes gene_type:complete
MAWFLGKNNYDAYLHEENNNLKNKNLELENEIKRLEKQIIDINLNKNDVIDMELDKSAENIENKLNDSVKKLVDDILKNDSINSSLIPDYIERKIYENIFKVFIGLIKEILENTNFNLLNQNIKFTVTS